MAGLDRVRAKVVPSADGEVLEIGLGTGLNLVHYQAIERLVAVEPDPHMRRRAEARLGAASFPTELLDCSAEDLPFQDQVFDTVVATFVLCTIPDPEAAVHEMHRVLRPGGRVLFAEHTVSGHAAHRAVQGALDPVWCRIAGGCHLTRDPVAMLRAADFEVQVTGPRRTWSTLLPVYRGVARRGV